MQITVLKQKDRKYYEVRWTDPVSGKKRSKSTKCSRLRDAERFAAKFVQEHIESGGPPENMKWGAFVDRYKAEVLVSHSRDSMLKNQTTFNHLGRLVKPCHVKSLTDNVISSFTGKLLAEGVSPVTVKSYLACLRAALNWASDLGIISRKPVIKMPKAQAGMKGRPITREELERMLDAAETVVGKEGAESWKWLLNGLWWSGLRIGEAMKLHWTDQEKISIDLGGDYPAFRIQAKHEKGRKHRLLPIAPEFCEMLLSIPECQRSGNVFNPRPIRPPYNVSLGEDWVGRLISRIGKEANVVVSENEGVVKYASAHDLRRSFGFRWSRRLKAADLMMLMRHESITTTMQFYVGQDADEAARNMWQAAGNKTVTLPKKYEPGSLI